MLPAEQHRGLLRAEVMRELCVELIYNYYFSEHHLFSFAYVYDVSLNCVDSCYVSCIDTIHTFIS